MSKIRKRLERFLRNPKEARWDEVVTILRYYGFTVEEPEGNSHWVIYHEDIRSTASSPSPYIITAPNLYI